MAPKLKCVPSIVTLYWCFDSFCAETEIFWENKTADVKATGVTWSPARVVLPICIPVPMPFTKTDLNIPTPSQNREMSETAIYISCLLNKFPVANSEEQHFRHWFVFLVISFVSLARLYMMNDKLLDTAGWRLRYQMAEIRVVTMLSQLTLHVPIRKVIASILHIVLSRYLANIWRIQNKHDTYKHRLPFRLLANAVVIFWLVNFQLISRVDISSISCEIPLTAC